MFKTLRDGVRRGLSIGLIGKLQRLLLVDLYLEDQGSISENYERIRRHDI